MRREDTASAAEYLLLAETLDGLAARAEDELVERFGEDALLIGERRPDAVRFYYRADLRKLRELQSVTAVYLVLEFDVPRPKALLGHQHFERLVQAIEHIRSLYPRAAFQSMKLAAAGDESAVMTRLKDVLAQRTGLPAGNEGDLLLRLRRTEQGSGWETLIRVTPRPLATRSWRVCNLPGAMNATLAHAMMYLSEPRTDDRVLNVCCGSGTLLIERLALAAARTAIGCDTSAAAIACAHKNVVASGYGRAVQLEQWDATKMPLPDASVDVICGDLPFGQLVGSHRSNETLYPGILAEAARVAIPGARMVLLTHEIRLLEHALDEVRGAWDVAQVIRVHSGGMAPRIFVLERRG